MTQKVVQPAPEYQPPLSRPPSYRAPSGSAPQITITDEKARLIPTVEAGPHPTEVSPPITTAPAPIASTTTSLQPFSKVQYPAASHIPESSWKAFVSDLRSAVAPTGGQKALAILAGTGVWIGTSWLPLGAIVGALVWKKAVEKRVAQDLGTNVVFAATSNRHGNTIPDVVDQYNTLWRPLGVRVRIDAINAADLVAAHMCQCNKQVEYRPGCGGKMIPYVDGRRADGCCASKCRDCGKWRGRKCEKLKDKARKPIVQITVEKIGRNEAETARGAANADTTQVDEKQDWVKVEGEE